MRGSGPVDRLVPAVRSTQAAAAGFCMCLSVTLLTLPGPAVAQEGSSSMEVRQGIRAAGALVHATRAGGLLRASGVGILEAAAGDGLDGELVGSGAGPAPNLPAAGSASRGSPPLFREVSALERGWSLVGRGGLLEGRWSNEEPEAAAVLPGGSEETEESDDEAPFLVRLFDARHVMLWIRDAREWGEEARRVVFGPRGLVRAGSVPGSDRPRVRLELTDSRPGAQVVIITR